MSWGSRGLRMVRDRVGEGRGQPSLDAGNGEELMRVELNVGIVFGDSPPLSPGTLYISNKRVVWLSDMEREKGYAVDFLSVSLHAISRDPAAYPHPCIYAQIDNGDSSNEDEESETPECNGCGDLSRIREIRFMPSDPSHLDSLFEVFCECAELNPDPNADEDEEDTWVYGEDMLDNHLDAEEHGREPDHPAGTIGLTNGIRDHDLAHGIHELHIDDRRFEDAEEMQPENPRDYN